MPDKKANKNYNISITDKEEIVKESISEITKQFFEKIELVGKQIFENVNKQYQEEIMALKLEITQLTLYDSLSFMKDIRNKWVQIIISKKIRLIFE